MKSMCSRALPSPTTESACMVNGAHIGGFGGGWLEHPRQWQSREACPEEAQGPSWGPAKGAL